jgi:hypothetical protein
MRLFLLLALGTALAACGNKSAEQSGGTAAATQTNGTGKAGSARTEETAAKSATGTSSDASAEDPVIGPVKAAYARLTSYADTGTVVKETPGVITRSRVTTFYRRKPLDFFLDYEVLSQEMMKTVDDYRRYNRRRVFWMHDGELQTYAFDTRDHQIYPPTSNQTNALMNSSAFSDGVTVLIPGVLFGKSALPSTIRQIEEAKEVGTEDVDGKPCRKILAIAADYYPSGQRVSVRPVTLWVDMETSLIRKVFEDTPKAYGANTYSRLTVTLAPQANPPLDDSKFEFNVPPAQQ